MILKNSLTLDPVFAETSMKKASICLALSCPSFVDTSLSNSRVPLALQVRLVSKESDDDVFFRFLSQHIDPRVETLEALDLCLVSGNW